MNGSAHRFIRVAYVLAECPYETFIDREITAMPAAGVAVDVYPLRESGGTGLKRRCCIRAHERLIALLWALGRPLRLLGALASLIGGSRRQPRELARFLRNVPTAAAFARRIQRTPAVAVHAHFGGEPASVARIISNLLTIPYTFSIHARDIFVENRTLPDRMRCARAVAACTMAAARRARQMLPPEFHDRIRVVSHGLNSIRDNICPPGNRDGSVLMVARLVEKKGVPVLLHAMAALRETGAPPCTIVGDGPERPAIERLIAELGLADSVRLAGGVENEHVPEYMARAGVLAVPSVVAHDGDSDGLPNVILEAAAAGLPVVASDVGGIAEFVADGETGLLVPPDDPAALAAAIRRLLGDIALCTRLAGAAQRKVVEEYDAERNAGKLAEAMGWNSQRNRRG